MSVCHICGVEAKNFSRRCLFEDHIKTHDTGRIFVCPFCGKSFPKYYSFVKHQEKYHSTYSFTCDVFNVFENNVPHLHIFKR